jgi:hypothetical protein
MNMDANDDSMTTPLTTPPCGQEGAQETSAWFEAATPAGPVRLCTTGAARHAADAAIVLDRCEDLLDSLDNWMGSALAWRWIGAPAAPLATPTHTYAEWRAAGGTRQTPQCLLEWPWALLRSLPAPTGALTQQLHWPVVPTVLVVAQLRIEDSELAGLEPGGAVLLAQSVRPQWQGLLRAAYEPARCGVGVPVDLGSLWAPRVIAGSAPSSAHAALAAFDSTAQRHCEVRLATQDGVGADCLTGWAEFALGEVGPLACLWRCAGDGETARHLATGRLMPWGDGWALALQAVGERGCAARIV